MFDELLERLRASLYAELPFEPPLHCRKGRRAVELPGNQMLGFTETKKSSRGGVFDYERRPVWRFLAARYEVAPKLRVSD